MKIAGDALNVQTIQLYSTKLSTQHIGTNSYRRFSNGILIATMIPRTRNCIQGNNKELKIYVSFPHQKERKLRMQLLEMEYNKQIQLTMFVITISII